MNTLKLQEHLEYQDILKIYTSGCKDISQHSIGVEYERLPISVVTNKAVDYGSEFGVCNFLRAFAYFQLVRAYGPCPIHTQPISEGGNPHQPRASVVEVYEQIISDLQQAEELMYSTKSPNYQQGRPLSGEVWNG